MKLIDCCMYFDEDLMLDIRLNTLYEKVDKFLIAEATRDHSGKEKKFRGAVFDGAFVSLLSQGVGIDFLFLFFGHSVLWFVGLWLFIFCFLRSLL